MALSRKVTQIVDYQNLNVRTVSEEIWHEICQQFSLGYGLTLLLIPDIFCDVLKAEKINTAWLRTIGAALLGTNVLGCWLWLKTPNLDMGRVQLATAGLEAFAMALSLMLGEFTAERIWMVQASVFLAIIVTIGLIPAAQGSYYEENPN